MGWHNCKNCQWWPCGNSPSHLEAQHNAGREYDECSSKSSNYWDSIANTNHSVHQRIDSYIPAFDRENFSDSFKMKARDFGPEKSHIAEYEQHGPEWRQKIMY